MRSFGSDESRNRRCRCLRTRHLRRWEPAKTRETTESRVLVDGDRNLVGDGGRHLRDLPVVDVSSDRLWV